MEEFSDKIVYIIVGLIILVVNFATKTKKQAERPVFQPYNEDVFEEETQVQKSEYEIDESTNSQEIILKDETQYYKEIKKDSPQNTTKSKHKNPPEIEEFDLRKAVIYSEVLNRKY